jgi:hypothetical protein
MLPSKKFSALGALALLGSVVVTGPTASAQPKPNVVAGEMHGIVPLKAAGPAVTNTSLLTSHGGEIMTSSAVQPVFWGTSWQSYSGDKITGIDSFYAGLSGTSYMGTNTEYTGTNGRVGTTVTSQPSLVKATAAPTSAPTTAQVLNVVAETITNPVSNGYYPVYSDQKRGNAGYCAWHSYGAINGVPVQFAFFFNLDGDSGCDPADTRTTYSQGLEAIVNVSGHEISEAVTDPRNGGWWDKRGYENSDKCAWTFSSKLVTLANGTSWKVQGNWSNAAYRAASGYDGRGCVDGQ